MALRLVALAGGVGGAKLVDGLAGVMQADDLTVVVNTGDDFDHLGLRICPDLDTIVYTLAGVANQATGWGRRDETWNFLDTVGQLGGPTWFRLGDRDLAVHTERTRWLNQGQPLSIVTDRIRRALGAEVRVLPMSDDPVATIVMSEDGPLAFQDYFVQQECAPRVLGFRFEGVGSARPAPGVSQAIAEAEAVVLCPSNPWVSLDPILAVPGVRQALEDEIVVGVSPIVGGQAIRGPAAKMFEEMGIAPSALAVAEHFGDLLCGWVIDDSDAEAAEEIEALGLTVLVANTIMVDGEDRIGLAGQVLEFITGLLQQEAGT